MKWPATFTSSTVQKSVQKSVRINGESMKINGQVWSSQRNCAVLPFVSLERNDPALKKLEGYSGAYGSSMDVMLKLVAKLFKGTRYLEVGTFDGIILSLLAWTYPMREF